RTNNLSFIAKKKNLFKNNPMGSFARIILLVFIYCTPVLIFAVSCQSQSDYATGTKGEVNYLLYENEPSRTEKERRWKEGFAYVTKVIDGDTFWVDNG